MTNCKANLTDAADLDVHTTVRIPRWVQDRLRAKAQSEYRTVSQEVRRLLIEHVQTEDERTAA